MRMVTINISNKYGCMQVCGDLFISNHHRYCPYDECRYGKVSRTQLEPKTKWRVVPNGSKNNH